MARDPGAVSNDLKQVRASSKESKAVLTKAVFPGSYIQGRGALQQLPAIVDELGGPGLILASPSVRREVIPKSGLDLERGALAVEPFGGECCEQELARLAAVLEQKQARVLIGMGGGKTIDTAKIAADRAGVPVVIAPTIASTDAPCSRCAVVYSTQGVYESVHYQKFSPAVVLVDTEVIVQAPVRFLVAGMGDALATWFEARSCYEARSQNECGGRSTLAALHLAQLCYDTLLEYGAAAKLQAERQLITPAVEHIIEANTLLSGLGFESGGLASAHAIHNGLTAVPETHAYWHGEKVAFGTLAGLQLNDASPDESASVYAFCEQVGLPTTLADIGLDNSRRDHLRVAAQKACAPGECIHHEPGEIVPEAILHALLAADAVGEARKAARE